MARRHLQPRIERRDAGCEPQRRDERSEHNRQLSRNAPESEDLRRFERLVAEWRAGAATVPG